MRVRLSLQADAFYRFLSYTKCLDEVIRKGERLWSGKIYGAAWRWGRVI